MLAGIVPAAAATPLPDASTTPDATSGRGAGFDQALEASLQAGKTDPKIVEGPKKRFADPLAIAEWMLAAAPQGDAAAPAGLECDPDS